MVMEDQASEIKTCLRMIELGFQCEEGKLTDIDLAAQLDCLKTLKPAQHLGIAVAHLRSYSYDNCMMYTNTGQLSCVQSEAMQNVRTHLASDERCLPNQQLGSFDKSVNVRSSVLLESFGLWSACAWRWKTSTRHSYSDQIQVVENYSRSYGHHLVWY